LQFWSHAFGVVVTARVTILAARTRRDHFHGIGIEIDMAMEVKSQR